MQHSSGIASAQRGLGKYSGDFVHERLAIGPVPTLDDVPHILEAGIKSIINVVAVCDREQMEYLSHVPKAIRWKHVGFWDGISDQRPPTSEQLTADYALYVVEEAALVVKSSSPSLIHCWGGRSRSGNLGAILYAAIDGIHPSEALERMRRFRPSLSELDTNGFWRNCNLDELVSAARRILLTTA